MPQLPPLTRNLMIACLAILCLEQFDTLQLLRWFALWPVGTGYFMPWQLITYAFLHSPTDWTHLFFNMLGFWMFGVELEMLWGSRRYAQYLLASALAAGLTQLVFSLLLGAGAPVVGASGAVFGLLLANGMLFPRRPIALFMVFPTDMRTAVIIFGALELMLGIGAGAGSFVAHFAHLGGMLGGYLMLLWWRRRPPAYRRRRS